MDGGEYLVPLCSSAPHYGRHFIEPIHVTISIIYQILARLWVQVIIKRRSICTIFFSGGKHKQREKCISLRMHWGRSACRTQLHLDGIFVASSKRSVFCPFSQFQSWLMTLEWLPVFFFKLQPFKKNTCVFFTLAS